MAEKVEVEEVNPDNESEDTEEEQVEEWTPPSQEEFEKVKRTAEARKADMAKLRKELGEYKAKAGKADDAQAEDSNLKTKRIAGVAALAAEGLNKNQAKMLVKMLDLSSVELDDDGDGDFSDAIESLKETFPQLFTKEAEKKNRPKVSTKNRGDGGGNYATSNPALAEMLKSLGH